VADGLQLALGVTVDIKLGCETCPKRVQANARLEQNAISHVQLESEKIVRG